MRPAYCLFFFIISCAFTISQAEETYHHQYTVHEIVTFYSSNELNLDEKDSLYRQNDIDLRKSASPLLFQHSLAKVILLKNEKRYTDAVLLLEKIKTEFNHRISFREEATFTTIYGIILLEIRRFEDARDYFDHARIIYQREKDTCGQIGVIINTGISYFDDQDFTKALHFFEQAQQLMGNNQDCFHRHLYNNLATTYQNINRSEESKTIYHYLINTATSQGVFEQTIIYNLSLIHYKDKNYDSAYYLLNSHLNQHSTQQLYTSESFYRLYANVLSETNRPNEAIYYFQKADSLLKLEDAGASNFIVEDLKIQREKELNQYALQLKNQKIREINQRKNFWTLLSISFAVFILIILRLQFVKNQRSKQLADKNYELSQQQESRLLPSQHSEIIEKLNLHLIQKKLFLEEGLNLEKLAKKIQSNRTYLSEAINAHYGMNFNQLVAKLRVEEARSLLANQKFAHYSIEGISKTAGFKSISSFNQLFKKETGITPSYFRKRASMKWSIK